MSPLRRKGGWLRGVGTAIASLPYVVAEKLPRGKGKPGRQKRKWTRPRRIAVALVAVGVLGAGAAVVAILATGRDPLKRAWRLHDEAVDAFAAERYEEVVAKCDEILDLNPMDGIARFNKGLALMRLKREEEGMRVIREAALTRPDFDDAHVMIAQDALARGDEDEAVAELRLVVANPPSPGSAESLLAALLRRRGRDAEAMPHLDASADDPLNDPVTRVRNSVSLGRIHGLRATVPRVAAREKRLENDSYMRARQIADETLARLGDDKNSPLAELHAARAEALVAMGRANEALVDADLALGAAKDSVARSGLRLLRAQIYSLLGDAAAADKELDAALSASAKPSGKAFGSAADVYVTEGRLDRALEILSRGVAEHPEDLELGLGRANLMFQSGQLADAEKECLRLAQADPKGTSAWLLLGDVRRARDDLDGARAAYEEAASRRPADTRAKLSVAGTAFAESGVKSKDADARLAEAERLANEVLKDSPGDALALLALAKVKLARSPGRDRTKEGDPGNAEARKMLLDAVEAEPLSIEARTFLGYADWLTRNDQDGAVELRRVLALVPEDRPLLRLLLARCLVGAGAYSAAADEARRVVAARPDDVEAWNVRADATWAGRDFDAALDAVKNLERLEPGKLAHLFRQAQILGETGRFAAAEERFDAAEEKTKSIADEGERGVAEQDVAEARAAFYSMRGDGGRARRTFDDLLDKGATSAGPFVRYAKLLFAMKQNDDAQRQVERGLAIEPSSVEARRVLCDILFARGEVTPVLLSQIQEVERATKDAKDPAQRALPDYLRGKLATLQGDFVAATQRLASYCKAAPDDPYGQFAWGVTLVRAGDFAEALKRFEAAAELAPGTPEVRVALAKTRQAWAVDMIRRGRVLEAQSALRQAIREDDTREARSLLVDALRFTGEIELSEREVRALLHADATDKAALRMLAAIQVQKGKLDDAEVTLKSLCVVAPDDWTAWQFLSAVQSDRGDLDAAEVSAKTSRAAAPDEPGALAATLQVLVRRGDLAAAEKEIAAEMERRPAEPRYPYFLAMLREMQDRHEDAVAAAAKALDLRPSTPGAFQLGVYALLNGLGDADRAAAFARERAAKAKDDPTTQYELASLEASLGRRDVAQALLDELCKGDAPLPAALTLRGLLLLEVGEFSKARDAMKKGIDTYADAPDLHYLLAQSLLQDPSNSKDGEPQEPARSLAVAELKKVLDVSRLHAPAMNNLAWLLSRDEATRAEALQLAETAVKLYPGAATYIDTWGTALLRLSRNDLAVAAFRRALGACETERAEIEKRSAKKVSTVEATRLAALRKRLAATTAEAQRHYDEALKIQSGK